MTRFSTKGLQAKRDDTAITIASIFNCTASYVRQVMADTTHKKHKGPKTMAIRKAFLKYKHNKQRFISKIPQFKKAA